MQIRPCFYDDFSCLAQHCRHSCCRGWEIDVDENSRQYYQALPGPLGEELRAALQEEDGVWSFRLTEKEDCPFLQADGLCRLILSLGENSLCDTCALHPRFFADAGELELAGLGLCCEAAAALLLNGSGKLRFLNEDDESFTLEQMLGLEETLRFVPTTDVAYYREIFQHYARCEAIDEDWNRNLSALAADLESAAEKAKIHAKNYDRELYDRILAYILYRQLEHLKKYGLPVLTEYAREAVDFIFLQSAVTGDLKESLRRWSAEIEYSTENAELLLQAHREN